MTVAEMLDEVKRSLGNRTDVADTRYLLWLNWAMDDICGFHAKRVYSSLRFHDLEEEANFVLTVKSGTPGASSALDFVTMTGALAIGTDDYYDNWIVKATSYTGAEPDGLVGQVRVIHAYDGTTFQASVTPVFGVALDVNTTIGLYKRRYHLLNDIGLSPDTVIYAIEKMIKVGTGGEIGQRSWDLLTGGKPDSLIGEPGLFARRGNTILFDKYTDEELAINMFYYRYPVRMVIDGASCELPEQFHSIVVAGAIARGFDKMFEPSRAQAAEEKYVSLLTTRRSPQQIADKHTKRTMKVKFS